MTKIEMKESVTSNLAWVKFEIQLFCYSSGQPASKININAFRTTQGSKSLTRHRLIEKTDLNKFAGEIHIIIQRVWAFQHLVGDRPVTS